MGMRKVLVTGGAGFIGSHLCEALLQRGDEVFVIDDLSTGRMENIAHLQDKKAFHFTVGSILDMPRLEPLVRKVDVIFHLAAVVGVQKIIEVPVDTIEINVLGSHNVLNLPPVTASYAWSPPLRKFTAKAPSSLSPKTTMWFTGRPPRAAGVMPAQKPLTNF
jgi:dTDP-D-glucose 4,6-dehydratase